jgi:hypothetical protein
MISVPAHFYSKAVHFVHIVDESGQAFVVVFVCVCVNRTAANVVLRGSSDSRRVTSVKINSANSETVMFLYFIERL